MASYVRGMYREELLLEPFRVRLIVLLVLLAVALDRLAQVFGERGG